MSINSPIRILKVPLSKDTPLLLLKDNPEDPQYRLNLKQTPTPTNIPFQIVHLTSPSIPTTPNKDRLYPSRVIILLKRWQLSHPPVPRMYGFQTKLVPKSNFSFMRYLIPAKRLTAHA